MRDNKSMWRMTSVGLLGLLVACGSSTPTPTPLPPPPTATPESRCPLPTSCTIANGTGVYFAEGGFAGMGPTGLMITHFTNGSTVTAQGRFFDITTGLWTLSPPLQLLAEYNGKTSQQVISLTESNMVPTWMLRDPASGSTTPVSGEQLPLLKLAIMLNVPGSDANVYLLDFAGPPSDFVGPPPKKGGTWKIQEHTYGMRWTDPRTGVATQYCHDAMRGSFTTPPLSSTASLPADSVVFQQGIDVDPVTGAVTANPNDVTMSCYWGAPAVVHRWGYGYRGGDLWYFAAGIHMKRASYCGDAAYYTETGTSIQIQDNLPIEDDPIAVLEASWMPTGASCLNPEGERRPDIIKAKTFTGACSSGPIPPCQSPQPKPPSTTRFLIDGPR